MRSLVEVRDAGEKGRGVFATKKISKGQIIELAPIILINRVDHKRIKKTHLNNYIFDAGSGRAAVALGTASLYNHYNDTNANYEIDSSRLLICVTASRTIYPGEEIVIDYVYDAYRLR